MEWRRSTAIGRFYSGPACFEKEKRAQNPRVIDARLSTSFGISKRRFTSGEQWSIGGRVERLGDRIVVKHPNKTSRVTQTGDLVT